MVAMKQEFRHLPSVDKVLTDIRLRRLEAEYPHDVVVNMVRQQIARERLAITTGSTGASLDEIVVSVLAQAKLLEKTGPQRVINATGVILHTNLGRAPLSPEALAAMKTASEGYCNLEINLDRGTRGSRHVHVESLLCQLTGAEAGLVVNNNASGVLLGLTALAKRKEVIVSRGQSVEIGGGFRIPDVMRQSGAKLIEVGTTNCTYTRDYEQAISPRTAALLRVHSSNFTVVGFTSEVSLEVMVAIGNRNGLPVLDDLGSGCFLDTARFGLEPEPVVSQSVALGAGLTFFSGDKLVGGPQAGIIVGKKQFVDKLKKHPLARAVRIDKVRLAGLAATLVHYLKGEAETKIPVWRMIAAPLEDIERRAEEWSKVLGDLAQIVPGETMIGGGSVPGGTLPTRLVAIGGGGKQKDQAMAHVLSRELRTQRVPVMGRVSDDVLLLDPRSVLPEEDGLVMESLRQLIAD